MSYTVKIVDNKTGKVVVHHDDATVIFGVIDTEHKTHTLNAVDAIGLDMGIAYYQLTGLVDKLEKEHPEVKIVADMCKAFDELDTHDSDSDES